MDKKADIIDSIIKSSKPEIVSWSDTYATGIELIDNQHMELVKLTNELYMGCMSGKETANAAFKATMSRMVEYVSFHFTTEQKLLELVKYPKYREHKKLHDTLVVNILEAVKEYEKGTKFVPNQFVRTLKDWIFGHIAVFDKGYSLFIREQKKKGLITDGQLSKEQISNIK